MGAEIDSLEIKLQANAQSANRSLDALVRKLDVLTTSLGRVNGNSLTSLSNGVQRLSNSMQSMKSVGTADFTRLAKNIQKMGEIDAASVSKAASSIHRFSNALAKLDTIKVSDNAAQIGALANGIKQLGYKSATQAINNIPKLATAMKQLMATLSGAPKVSQNLIDMTNALAKLARTGASSGRAANSLSKTLNTYTASAKKASGGTKGLASAIGKLYAGYWLLFRAFGKIGDAINISSDLTEVQNVVDVTFGKYTNLVEKMSETSIVDFGMSELTVKQVASRFQAMGTAMGFAQGKMADMSVELTKLTADMASFYNVEQADVAEDLESIFTGQTRPLRTYGLDLTQATLAEWAMKNGLDADIQSMSQAEKTMLRYQYVLANTTAAQGDFSRTADTWANQVRILKQNFQQLASVIGGVFINALKPLVKALNAVMSHIIAFAETISNALGKIFGWKFEKSGGGITNDFEDAAGSADDIADATGDAAKNIDKMQKGIRAFDELKTINIAEDSKSGGSGSGSGTSSGGSADGGQWTKVDSIFDTFESEIDTLYKLGDYIGKTLTKAMNDIDWDSIYQGAKNFGKGLADFLNGLISPELFGATGRTIAGALNTAVYAALSFGETFDWTDFGKSVATGINEFFSTFDFKATGEAISKFARGILQFATEAVKDVDWGKVGKKIAELISAIDWSGIAIDLGGLAWAILKALEDAMLNIGYYLTLDIIAGITGLDAEKLDKAIQETGLLESPWFKFFSNPFEFIENLVKGEYSKDELEPFDEGDGKSGGSRKFEIGVVLSEDDLTNVATRISAWFNEDIAPWFTKEKWQELGNNIKEGLLTKWNEFTTWWTSTGLYTWWTENVSPWFTKEKWQEFGDNVKSALSEKWEEFTGWWKSTGFANWWNDNVKPWFTKEKWVGIAKGVKDGLTAKWNEFTGWWKTTGIYAWWTQHVAPYFTADKWSFSGIKDGLESAWNAAVEAIKGIWNNFASWLNSKLTINIDTNSTIGEGISKALGATQITLGSIPMYKTGGFPEDGLFMANHGELLGEFSNGKTAVANNMQITQGIANAVYPAVYNAVSAAMQNTGANTSNQVIKVYVGDRELTDIAIDGINERTKRTGRTPIELAF